jgi:crotonobetainyl-CoA:carnitine CoA-transferase CaiB-like acyl-CoA transferase
MDSVDPDTPAGPLAGIRIIELTHAAAGPFAGMLLGDLGADVIKVEPPQGELVRFASPHRADGSTELYGGRFASRNRNKRSIALDLTRDDHRQTLLALVETADALLENYRTGVLDRLGVGWDVCHRRNPRLVYAAIRGFGDPRTGSSPLADWPAYDIVAQAMGGLVASTGPGPDQPMRVGPIVGDTIPGLMVTLGLVAALVHARSTGEGQFLDVAMVDAIMSMCSDDQTAWDYQGVTPQPHGSSRPDVTPFDIYQTLDGHCAIAAPTGPFWLELCSIIDAPDMAADPDLADMAGRVAQRERVDGAVAEWVHQRTTAQVVEALGGRVPVGPVKGPPDWADDAHVAARQMLIDVEHAGSTPSRQIGQPIKFTATPSKLRRRPPVLDEHGAELRRELGGLTSPPSEPGPAPDVEATG